MKIYSININFTKIIFLFLMGNYNFYTSQQQEEIPISIYTVKNSFEKILDDYLNNIEKIKNFFNDTKAMKNWERLNNKKIDEYLNSQEFFLQFGFYMFYINIILDKILYTSPSEINIEHQRKIFLNDLQKDNIIKSYYDEPLSQHYYYIEKDNINAFLEKINYNILLISSKRKNLTTFNEILRYVEYCYRILNNLLKSLNIQYENINFQDKYSNFLEMLSKIQQQNLKKSSIGNEQLIDINNNSLNLFIKENHSPIKDQSFFKQYKIGIITIGGVIVIFIGGIIVWRSFGKENKIDKEDSIKLNSDNIILNKDDIILKEDDIILKEDKSKNINKNSIKNGG